MVEAPTKGIPLKAEVESVFEVQGSLLYNNCSVRILGSVNFHWYKKFKLNMNENKSNSMHRLLSKHKWQSNQIKTCITENAEEH
jgi:hypothetical protein